jgi:hypothetical protein
LHSAPTEISAIAAIPGMAGRPKKEMRDWHSDAWREVNANRAALEGSSAADTTDFKHGRPGQDRCCLLLTNAS